MKNEGLIEIAVYEGSLVVSPLMSKEENIEMFNKWLIETYENNNKIL
jgi:hypothetical protein